MNAPAIPIAEKHAGLAFAFSEMRGRSIVAIALAIPPLLVALLLSGAWQIAAVGGILFIVGMLLDVYRFEVDAVRQKIKIRTLWLGWRERGAVTYAFADVLRLDRASATFDGDSLVGWETKCVHWDVGDETIPVTELRLVVRAAGGEVRYVLLACRDHSAAYWWRAAPSRFVRALAEILAALTGLPVREADGHAASGARE